ncbi:MAG: hypothetical protein ABEK16_01935 [Candidatus Nanohalobium sp.]
MEYRKPLIYGAAGTAAFAIDFYLFSNLVPLSTSFGALTAHVYLQDTDEGTSLFHLIASTILPPLPLIYGALGWALNQVS